MKKVIITLILAGLILLPAFSAYADVVVEPENDFYSRNWRDIVPLDRSFYVSAPSGFASLKKEPGARKDIAQVENGESIYVTHSCLYNGEFWGLTSAYLDSQNSWSPEGWISMDDLLVKYDYIAFAEAHYDEFYTYEGDIEEIKSVGAALVWPWPGAEAPLWRLEEFDIDNLWIYTAYKDDAGREWGFVSYLYGSQNIWVCISDPINPDIPAFNPAPPPMKWVSDTEHTNIVGDKNNIPVLIIVLVAAVVIGTFILITVLWKKKKPK